MRKLIILVSFAAALITVTESCRKDSYVADFSKSPEARMADTIAFVKKTLTSSPNGWIAVTPVFYGGGYGFYMNFDSLLNVTMYSDLIDQFASTSMASQTRVRADMGVALTFDTYNYISELNSPDNNVRNGFGGDVDYIYDHTNGDSIIFLGKRYRMPLSFVKATAAQATAYNSGGYLTAINAFKSFFITNANAYITLDNGTQVMIVPNSSNDLNNGKRVTLIAQDAKGNVSVATSKFAFTADKMVFLDSGVNISNLRFVNMAWKDSKTLAIYNSAGKEYIINNSVQPVVALYQLMGLKYYLFGGYKTIYPGTSAAGQTILNSYYNGLANSGGYAFNYGTLSFTWNLANSRVTLTGFCSQNGGSSGWNTTIVYTYTVDNNGNYTFTKFSAASGGYTAPILTTLDNFMTSNVINLDYYTDPATKTVYGKMTSVKTPTTIMTFKLQQ